MGPTQASHPPLCAQLSVREKNRKEVLGGLLRSIVRSADEVLITGISGLKVTLWLWEETHERSGLPGNRDTLGAGTALLLVPG